MNRKPGKLNIDVAAEGRLWVAVLLLLVVRSPGFAASFATFQNSNLLFPAAELLTNGVPGLTNPPPELRISSVSPGSTRGGTVSLMNTQAWMQRYNGSMSNYDIAKKVIVDGAGDVIATGSGFEEGSFSDFITIKYSSAGVAVWTNRYDGPNHDSDGGTCLAVDATNNVYVSGTSWNVSNTYDIVTIKYSSNGQGIWTNRYSGGLTNLEPAGLVADAPGNAYLLFDSLPESAGSGAPYCSYVLVKYDPVGNLAWENRFKLAPTSADHPMAVSLDRSGNVFVAGGSGPLPPHYEESGDFITLKYSADGVCLWTNRLALGADEEPSRLIADDAGNVTIIGESLGIVSSQGLYVTVRYTTDGTPLWTNTLPAPRYRKIPQGAVDSWGNVFVVGGPPDSGANQPDYTTVKLSRDGVPLWTNTFFGPYGAASLGGTAADRAGNFYFTGTFADQLLPLTLKYASDGTPLWTNRFKGPVNGWNQACDMTVDSQANVYVAGVSEGTSGVYDFHDFVVVKYADCIRYSPPTNFLGEDHFSFTVVDPSGNSVTGQVSVVVIPGSLQFNTLATNFQFTSHGLQLQVDGAPGTNPVILYASPDLADWHSVLTNMPELGSARFVDAAATNLTRRFYRAVQQR